MWPLLGGRVPDRGRGRKAAAFVAAKAWYSRTSAARRRRLQPSSGAMIAATSGATDAPESADSISSRTRRASTSVTCSAPSWVTAYATSARR